MDYIVEIVGFDPERGNYRTERKVIKRISEAVRLADELMEQNAFADEANIYLPSRGAFECFASRRRLGAWEIVRKVKR